MNTFEKVFITDPQREKTDNLDKHRCIELSDLDYLKLKGKMFEEIKIHHSQSVEPPKKKTKSKDKK